MQDAQTGRFDVVLAEALDRVSRDQADVATLFKHMQFAGVQIVTLAEGEISELHVGLKGTMNALFLKDLAKKTHRGLRGRVEKGKAGGGLSYGYDVVKRLGSDGEPVRGERTINEAQADVVRRIFRDFAAGKSPLTIARDLNAEGIPGPGKQLWSTTTLRGHVKRGTGLLNNELYVGKLVWNRQRYGRRVSRINPESEWITTDVQELRIVDDSLWQAVKARQDSIAVQYAGVIEATRARITVSTARTAQSRCCRALWSADAVAAPSRCVDRGGLPAPAMWTPIPAPTAAPSRAMFWKHGYWTGCATSSWRRRSRRKPSAPLSKRLTGSTMPAAPPAQPTRPSWRRLARR